MVVSAVLVGLRGSGRCSAYGAPTTPSLCGALMRSGAFPPPDAVALSLESSHGISWPRESSRDPQHHTKVHEKSNPIRFAHLRCPISLREHLPLPLSSANATQRLPPPSSRTGSSRWRRGTPSTPPRKRRPAATTMSYSLRRKPLARCVYSCSLSRAGVCTCVFDQTARDCRPSWC